MQKQNNYGGSIPSVGANNFLMKKKLEPVKKMKYPKFKLFSLRELHEQNHPLAEDYWGDEYEYRMGVFRLNYKGEPCKLIGTDGGQPEDKTLDRNLYWVLNALNETWETAYLEGKNNAS
jgi:hypothetical protein